MSFFQMLPADPRKEIGGKLGTALGQGLGVMQQNRQREQQQSSLSNLLFPGQKGLENLSPEQQLNAAKIMRDQQEKQAATQQKREVLASQISEARRKEMEERKASEQAGIPYGLSPQAQSALIRERQGPKKTQASQPIDPDQLKIIKDVRRTQEYKEASPLEKYQMMTDAGVSKENALAESDIAAKQETISTKSFDSSYKANEPFIKETTDKYVSFETETKPKLLQMQHIPDEDLVSPTAAVFLDTLGIPLGALEDPSSELYSKLSQDLLKGLPETYGNRILKVEVDNFLKTIPTLLNSANGRRMIASNMLKLGEMKEVFYNEMRRQQKEALEKNKFPRDFQQSVFDQVKADCA